MTPQKQRFRHRPDDGEIGDCHRTAIACLLDIDRDAVPHFGEHHFNDMAAFNQGVNTFLRNRGLATVDVAFNSSLSDVLKCLGALNPSTYYILGGMSRSGVNHSVIGCGGEIVWDPSLDDTGIVGPCDDGYYWITYLVPLTMVKLAG